MKPTLFFSLSLILSVAISLPAIGNNLAEQAVANTPREALIAIINAAHHKDGATVQAHLYPGDDGDKRLIPFIADIAVARANYGDALAEKFGNEAADKAGVTAAAAMTRLSGATEVTDGPKSQITFKDTATPGQLVLRRTESGWHAPIEAVIARIENCPADQVGGRYINIANVYTEMAAQIRVGQYLTAAAAEQTAADRVRNAADGNDSQ